MILTPDSSPSPRGEGPRPTWAISAEDAEIGWAIIRRTAHQMIGRAGLTQADRDDLEQELALQLWLAAARYDPTRSRWTTYATSVVRRTAAQILRHRLARKRGGDHQVVQLAGDIPASDPPPPMVALDVAAVVDSLPADLRDLAQRLMTQSLSQVARDLGVSRSTLRWHVGRIRRHFEAAGLSDRRE